MCYVRSYLVFSSNDQTKRLALMIKQPLSANTPRLMGDLIPDSAATPKRQFIQVCQYRSCRRFQSAAVLAAFKQYAGADLMVSASSCLGQCGSGPTVRVAPDNVWYCRVLPQDVATVIEQHIHQGKPVKRLLHPRFHPDYQRLLDRLQS